MKGTVTAEHIPVMLTEAVDALAVRKGGLYVDGTLGRAGHSAEIVRRGGKVLGIDRDDEALRAVAAQKIEGLTAVKGNHGDMETILKKEGVESVDDPSQGMTAAELVQKGSEEDLTNIFRTLGEEPNARRIAKAILCARMRRPVETTLQLAEIVEKSVGRHGAHHPATRVFQALRMAVNDELGELSRALSGGLGRLKSGGRFVVITFESLTDRAVKRFFVSHAGRMVSLHQGGARWEGDLPRVRLVTRRAARPSTGEMERNPRSRSARLRVAERV